MAPGQRSVCFRCDCGSSHLNAGGYFLIAAIAGGTATAIQFLQSWLATRGTAAFFQQAVGGSIAASAALLAAWLRQLNVPGFAEVHPGLVVIGSIVAMLAGLSVLGAAEDAIVGNYLSGGVHALQGIIQTLGIVAGISAVLTGAHHVGISVDLAYTISLTGLLSVSSAFWAGLVALGYGVYSRANMVTMLINLVLGGFAWAMMLRLLEVGWGQVSASAAVATVVGLVAGLLSAGLKVPHYAFSTAIVVPLLPGLLVYQGLMALMNDGAGFLAGQQTLNIAAGVGLALAAGVAVGAAVMKVLIPQRHLEPESHTTIT